MWQIKCPTRISRTVYLIYSPKVLLWTLQLFHAAAPAEGPTLTSKRLVGSRPYCWLLSSSCSPSKLQSVPSNGSEISVLRKDKGKYCHEWDLHRYIQKAGLSSLATWGLCLNLILKTKSPLSAWVYAISLGLIPEVQPSRAQRGLGWWENKWETSGTTPLLGDTCGLGMDNLCTSPRDWEN